MSVESAAQKEFSDYLAQPTGIEKQDAMMIDNRYQVYFFSKNFSFLRFEVAVLGIWLPQVNICLQWENLPTTQEVKGLHRRCDMRTQTTQRKPRHKTGACKGAEVVREQTTEEEESYWNTKENEF